MEDNLQRVFAILISVIIFFFMPMYISFEKKDDISYSLALKITDKFVNNVTSKGYISKQMYDNFVDELAATDNTYEIKMEHRAKRYYPVIIGHDADNNVIKYEAALYDISDDNNSLVLKSNGSKIYDNAPFEMSYDMKEEIYNEKQIIDTISSTEKPFNYYSSEEYRNIKNDDIKFLPYIYGKLANNATSTYNNIYTMSVGDEFSIVIKNTNTTIATSMFNTFTFSGDAGVRARVYINYGGTVKEESYRFLNFENASDI